MKRLTPVLYRALPLLLCLILYWPGLMAWFQQDDFAWLNLAQDMREGRSLTSALFTPLYGQGSLRPLGERAYYLGLPALFGFHAFPFRLLAFLTQFGSLLLVVAIVQRLTGSLAAGSLAASLWAANSKLFVVMSWSAEYMLILCGFLMLLAFYYFLRRLEEKRRRYLVYCWAAFLVGFGALETNAVFPAIAAAYAILCCRKALWKTAPMFAVAAGYTWLHMRVAPKAASGPYALQIDHRIPVTFWKYWSWSFIPDHLDAFRVFPSWTGIAVMALLSAALLGHVGWQVWRKRFVPLWFLSWFVITLLPVLPVPNHISDYYLTLPLLGLAMTGADALVRAWSAGRLARMAAISMVAAYLVTQVPVARLGASWWYERSQRGKVWLAGVKKAQALHPNKTILLTDVNDDLFWNAMAHRAPRALGLLDVWLAPGTEGAITPHPELNDVRNYVCPREKMWERFTTGDAEVYRIRDGTPERVTDWYRQTLAVKVVGPVWWFDVIDPEQEFRLGEGWGQRQAHFRFMAQRAVVWIPGPTEAGQQLWLRGFCPGKLMEAGPVSVTVKVEGRELGRLALARGEAPFAFSAPLDRRWVGKERLKLQLEASHAFTDPGLPGPASLVFGRFGIRRDPSAGPGRDMLKGDFPSAKGDR